jgi:hypothetical protein
MSVGRVGPPALGFCFAARGAGAGISVCGDAGRARRLHVKKRKVLGLSGAELAQLREEGALEWQGTRLTWEDLSFHPRPPLLCLL